MSTIPFTNTTGDGQVPEVNPDATTDYFLITDYNQDKSYLQSKMVEIVQMMSYETSNALQILYGGEVSDAGSGRINISEGAGIGRDLSGHPRLVSIPSLTNISMPSGYANDTQLWVVLKYKETLASANRQHFNGTTYIYQNLDSYVGNDNIDLIFTSSNPSGNELLLGSFKMNGTTYTDLKERSSEWITNSASLKRSIDYSKQPGEIFSIDGLVTENFVFNPSTPRTYFPAICLSTIDIYRNLNGANLSPLINQLLSVKLSYLTGKSGEVSSWSVTVSGSNITFPNNVSANAILAALAEDVVVHGGSYSNWRTVTIAGTNYAITNINLVTRVVTVTGTPATGTQTAEFYPHAVPGSSTTAREFEVSGKTIISGNDPDGYFISGLRTRGFMQGHRHRFQSATSSGSTDPRIAAFGNDIIGLFADLNVLDPISDGTNGTPRTRKTTHSPAVSGMLYKWVGAN